MATAQMDTVIRHLRRAVSRHDGAGWTDGQLLASFIDQKDEAAFAALVRRHGPMVFGVCRRVVGNHHDAEDALQATFLVLARKASSVRPRERLAGWLHGVALRTAMKARTMTARRRGREKQVTELPEPEAARQDPWRDLQPLLDQELNGLPETYRLPILLCNLEGKTIKDAARQLNWPQGTLGGRLARGRKLLAKRLANRGVVLSAGSAAAVVSQNVASAGVPTALMSSTVRAARLVAAGHMAVPVKVAALMEGVMKAMLITKLKTVTAALLVVAVVAAGGGLLPRTTTAAAQTAEERVPKRAGERQVTQTRTGSVERNERNFGIGFQFLNSLEYQVPVKANDRIYVVPFVDSGTVGSSPAPAEPTAITPKTDLDRLQGVWSVVSIEQGGKPAKLEKAVFMVDGKRACLQTSDSETQGGLYLDTARTPKTYDLAMSTRTIEGIYSLDGDTLRLRYDLGSEAKRPVGFGTRKGSHQVLFVLKRLHGPEVFPYRLADGTRAFPTLIDRKTAPPPPPQVAPTPQDNNNYDPGLAALGGQESAARPSPRIVATVNGKAIFAEEVYAAAYLSLPDAHNLTALDRSRRITAFWKKTLDRVIEREVIVQEAFRVLKRGNANAPKKLHEVAANEFGRRWVESVKRSTGLKDDEQLRDFLRAQGMSLDAVRRQWERDFIAEQYLRSRLVRGRDPAGSPPPDGEDARKQRARLINQLRQSAVIEYPGGR